MEIKSKFLCSRGVALAFAMLLGGSPVYCSMRMIL